MTSRVSSFTRSLHNMITTGQKVHIFVYDRNPQFRKTFAYLLERQGVNEGSVVLGNGSHEDPRPVQVTVVQDTSYYNSNSLPRAVADLSIGAIVSPANSFGRMEGGFDLAISLYYGSLVGNNVPPHAISKAVKTALLAGKSKIMGYNPTQNAERIPADLLLSTLRADLGLSRRSDPPAYYNGTNVPDLIHLPTMATPTNIHGGTKRLCDSVVFNCTWNLMATLAASHLYEETVNTPTLKILLTGLGTGVGGVPLPTAATIMFKAIYHYAKILHMTEENIPTDVISAYIADNFRKVPEVPYVD